MLTTAPIAAAADRLGSALALAERGFAVFPLRPGSKVPAVREDWEGLAVADPGALRERGWPPESNIGIACGPSGLFVLDLDVPKQNRPGGEPCSGAQALRELAAGRPIPRTFTVATPSGGTHLYFRAPRGLGLRNTVGRLGPLIDTRAAGGYVVAPGSVIGGRRYEITEDAPVAQVPRWIVRELTARPRADAASPPLPIAHFGVAGSRMPGAAAAAYGAAALRNEVERMRAARAGTRNDTLNRAAYALGRLVGAGLLDRDLAASELFQAARQTGLPARECSSTLASGLGAGIARPRFPARRRPAPRGFAVFDEADAAHGPARLTDDRLVEALRTMDHAYDAVALSAAALVFSQDWRRVRTLMDALRDLRDAAQFGPMQRRHAAQLCVAVGELAAMLERTVRASGRRTPPGRRRSRSPLGKALRDLKLAADAVIAATEEHAAPPGARRQAA